MRSKGNGAFRLATSSSCAALQWGLHLDHADECKNFYLIVEDYCTRVACAAFSWKSSAAPVAVPPSLELFFRAVGGNMANCGDFFNGLLAKQQRRFSRSTTTKVRTSCLGVEPPADLRPGRAPPADPGAPLATAACGISTAAHSNAAPRAGEENPG